jgi:DNA (cytosine-5)-methyltransferase 1
MAVCLALRSTGGLDTGPRVQPEEAGMRSEKLGVDTPSVMSTGLSVVGLFAGIGGIEMGLHGAGHETELLCEFDPSAQAVLKARFPGIPLVPDVRDLRSIPKVDLVAAGFPCQDLSQAGGTAGIAGSKSGLVGEVFRLLDQKSRSPHWLLLENVPFMLQLNRGEAMRFLTRSLEERGFKWAYRVLDTRAFGLPQRRQRVILLASRSEDPREVLFGPDAGELDVHESPDKACGFYWTEGIKGLGWAVDSVPTLKGGSTIGIPSPPAVVLPDAAEVVLPGIEDAERLQGFPAGWTLPAELGKRNGPRWKLVGNAVSVPVSQWVGERLSRPEPWVDEDCRKLSPSRPWPTAAFGANGVAWEVSLSPFPVRRAAEHLVDFLDLDQARPLSLRAAEGFLERYERGTLRKKPYLLFAMQRHITRMAEVARSA